MTPFIAIAALAFAAVYAVVWAIRHAAWLAVAAILLLVVLTGCTRAPASPDLQRIDAALEAGRPQIPESLLTCLPEPRSPGGAAGDKAGTRYVIGLVKAGRDCRSKIGAIRDVLEK